MASAAFKNNASYNHCQMSTPIFNYSDALLASLDRVLSQERLSRYVNCVLTQPGLENHLIATKADMINALVLYEQNIAVSEALFGFLHGLEVTVRNSINHTLAAGLQTSTWFDGRVRLPWSAAGAVLNFPLPMQRMINKAKGHAGINASAGKVLAELTFGFWPSLIASGFHESLWVPCLNKAFPNASVPRSEIHLRLEVIRHLRNRIAHHERILTSGNKLYTGFSDQPYIELRRLLECVQWVSADASLWLRSQFRYERAEEVLLEVSRKGISL